MRRWFSHIGAPFAVLAYGENHYNSLTEMNRMSSVHAEDNVIRNLPVNTQKRAKKIDMLVIRVTLSGDLANSKPCIHCILLMCTRLPLKGYTLRDIYYSTSNGTLEMCKFSALLFSQEHHVSRFHKERGLNIGGLIPHVRHPRMNMTYIEHLKYLTQK